MTRPKIGLALGSGGARGWCHIGILRALEQMGIIPDVIAGCSMGALVGAARAGDRLDALEDWARKLSPKAVFGYIDMRLSGGGLMGGSQIARLLGDIGLPEKIEDLPIPYGAVATDLVSGEEVWFRDGRLAPAIRGSVAIPGVFTPHEHEERWLLDGGLSNPVPVSLCRALGADKVIAVYPNAASGKPMWDPVAPPSTAETLLGQVKATEMLPDAVHDLLAEQLRPASTRRVPSYFEVVDTSIDILTATVLKQRLRSEPPDLLLEADLKHMSVLELNRADEAISHGADMVARREADLRALVG